MEIAYVIENLLQLAGSHKAAAVAIMVLLVLIILYQVIRQQYEVKR